VATPLKDLTGRTFERLTVLYRSKARQLDTVLWVCRCVCGKIKLVAGNNLKKGNTRSCGCLLREAAQRPRKVSAAQLATSRGERAAESGRATRLG
jgi:hypothetical protein